MEPNFQKELVNFAQTTLREELKMLKDSLLMELRDIEAPVLQRPRREEALHGAPEASGSSARRGRILGLGSSASLEEEEVAPKRPATMANHVVESLLGESSDAKKALERDLAATYLNRKQKKAKRGSVRYMSLETSDVENQKDPGRCSSPGACCLSVMSSHYFDVLSAWLVMLNAMWIGLGTDWVARNWSSNMPDYFHYGDWTFCALAIFELFIRIGAQGTHFFYEAHWKWNVFDTIVVATQVADLGGSVLERSAISGHVQTSHLQGLRVLKLTMVLIFACLYAVAVVITQLVSDHKIAVGKESMEASEGAMIEFFGSLDTTMISLYMVISEGIHWKELMDPLVENMGNWVRIVFVVFTGFELFAMMNIITACFVDSAMKIAANAEKQECLESLWGLLDQDALLDVKTQQKVVTKEQFIGSYGEPSMTKFLDLINAHTEDPKQVFAMIDRDGDGSLTAPEFLICCERLMGPSKASMLVKIANEQRLKMEIQERLMHKLSTDVKAKQEEMMTMIKNVGKKVRGERSTEFALP